MAQRRHRQHALRVAGVATLIVLGFYVGAVIVVNVIVTNHLISTTDNRLTDRLNDARQQMLAPSSSPRSDRVPTRSSRRSPATARELLTQVTRRENGSGLARSTCRPGTIAGWNVERG
jgi:hypothetical protein